MSETTQNRKVYLDYLRVFAMFAVILTHVVGEVLTDDIKTGTPEWIYLSALSSIVKWAVPIFLMISGTLFLSRNIEIKTIYKKYILRLFIALVFWSAVYTVLEYFTQRPRPRDLITTFVSGYVHLWYLYLMIALYMLVPILRLIVKNKQIMKYYMVLSTIFAFVVPMILNIDIVSKIASGAINNMHIDFVMGLTLFFVAGYYFSSVQISKRSKIIIYSIAVLSLLSYFARIIYAIYKLKDYYLDISLNTIGTLFISFAIYVLFMNICKNKKQTSKFVACLSKYSFGIYLVHMLIIKLSTYFDLPYTHLNIFLYVPIMFVLTSAITFVIVFVLKKIPIVNKYLV